jgi:hypothetical protein
MPEMPPLTMPLEEAMRTQRAIRRPLGWPRGRYGPTTRRPVGEVVHVDRFGNRPFRGR